ncbi:MAG: SIR2 family protein [Treponema sp.]|nr:SIR2 family protein [Treponema sp.]
MPNKLEKGEAFNLNVKRPKVLLLGNGIARAFNKGASWNELLKEITDESLFSTDVNYEMPMPLKAALLSNNKLESKLDSFIASQQKWGLSVNKSQQKFLQELLNLNFDYILTTNYTYEIECALLNMSEITKGHIQERRKYYSDSVQKKFLINTCHCFESKKLSVWHIHGDIYSPQSIALGHDCYGKLVGRYNEWINANFNNSANKEIKSWIDAFLYGDLYILGFGMDFSETDLWWLIEYKAKPGNFGKTVFFDRDQKNEVKKGAPAWCKRKLLEVFNVDVKIYNRTLSYKDFYKKACEDIKKEIGEKK